MKLPISGITERSPFIDRTLEFVAKFSCSFLDKEEKEDEENAEKDSDDIEEEEELPLFLYRIFAWLLDHHEVEVLTNQNTLLEHCCFNMIYSRELMLD